MKNGKRLKTTNASEIRYIPESDFEGQQIVSISKARRLLGSKAKLMSDTQVKSLVDALHLLAREHLCYSGSKDE